MHILKRTFCIVFFLLASFPLFGAVELGIDVLQKHDFAVLKGKRVGLITNQTGVNSAGTRTRVILHKAPNVKLVALFTPEHGLDGTELAGKYVSTRKDPVTGLTAHSLYGPTRKPTPQMLKGIDTLVFDMQDIGCRSYTYVSTMARCMEAAGEQGIEFIVLDRPNPLGGIRVEGPPLETKWTSFVGQFPVPYVHGMTVGELARMSNSKGWMAKKCNLKIIEMRGWDRRMTWHDTGLKWIRTSPNIPYASSPAYYVTTGIVGSLAGMDTGVGGPQPFQIIAAPWVNASSFTKYLQSLKMPGVRFTEYSNGSFRGSKIQIDPGSTANLTALGIYMMAKMNQYAKPDLFARSKGKLDIFYKVYGSDSIRRDLENDTPVPVIVSRWNRFVSSFKAERGPYLIY